MATVQMGLFDRLRERLAEGSLALALPLLQRGLLSDRWRGLVIEQLEKAIVSNVGGDSELSLPARVWQDKKDMGLAMLWSANRALERKQISPKVLGRLLKTFLVNSIMQEDQGARTAAKRFAESHEGQYPPALIVLSPTKTCNLHCPGCYASAQAGGGQLEWSVFDRIITEAKSLWGIRFFVISGGEPLMYRSDGHDLLDAVAKHSDCCFLVYTNGTLLDEQVAQRMAEAGNLLIAVSVEGFEARTDERRGSGVFQKVLAAMSNLRKVGVPYGISVTATRRNAEEVLSDEFLDFFFEEHAAVFGWLFQYMPVGRSYALDLVVTPQQRLWMWRRTWQIIRERRIMLADFWNCGTVSAGCIAAGQSDAGAGYLYIDWNGKVMPCVFVQYSAANIHDVYSRGGTLADVYDLPYFRAIRQWQRDYALGHKQPEKCGNLLLPCSLRDHYCTGRELIEKYHPEPADEAAVAAIEDAQYAQGMAAYDEALHVLFDPIWSDEYLRNCPAPERADADVDTSPAASPVP